MTTSVACAGRAPPGAEGLVVIEAALDSGGDLHVSLRIPRSALSADARTMRLPMSAQPAPSAGGEPSPTYADFVELPSGEPWPGSLDLDVPAGDLEVDYIVRLSRLETAATAIPHRTAGGWLLTGRAFIPELYVDGAALDLPAVLRFELPPGWRLDSSTHYLPANADPVLRGTLGEVRDAVHDVGTSASLHLVVGKTSVSLVSSFGAASLEVLAGLIEAVLDYGTRCFGPLGYRRRLIAYERLPRGFAAAVVGDGIAILASTPATRETFSAAGAFTVHELLHLWLPREPAWLGEGLATYFQILAQVHIDGLDEATAVEQLLRYQRRPPVDATGAALGAASGPDPQAGAAGALAAFCADVELHLRDQRLADVVRRTRTRTPRGTVELAPLLAELEALAPEAAKHIRDPPASPGAFDVAPCLRRAGYEVDEVTYRVYSHAELLDVLRVDELDPRRVEVLAARPGSALAVGDLLLTLEGTPILTLDDLSWALRDLEPGGTASAVILRHGEVAAVTLELPAGVGQGAPVQSLRARPGPGGTLRSPLRHKP